MHVNKTISVAAFIAILTVSGGTMSASARTLRDGAQPAEFPPASFSATQYVDSLGCIYVRAGRGDAVNWVPRVSRDRKVLCGFVPTFAKADTRLPVLPDPVEKPVEKPVVNVAVNPVVKTPTPKQIPTATVTAKPTVVQNYATKKPETVKADPLPSSQELAGKTIDERGCVVGPQGVRVICNAQTSRPGEYVLKRLPAGVTVRTVGGGRMTTTKPTLVRVPVSSSSAAPSVQMASAPQAPATIQIPTPVATTAKLPAPAATRQGVTASYQCDALSGNAAQFMTSTRMQVRCGPQTAHPSAYAQRQIAAETTRISSMNATVNNVISTSSYGGYTTAPVPLAVPSGYQRAWTDGRLNAQRGPRTASGDIQQAQVWTQTTPGYLHGQLPKRTFWEWLLGTGIKSSNTAARTTTVSTMTAPSATQTNVVLSTTSAAPAQTRARPTLAAPKVAANLRYVQVGTFGVAGNADKSIQRLAAMGFPVSSQVSTGKATQLKIVLAGPFANPQQTLSALARIRGVGYTDSFARK